MHLDAARILSKEQYDHQSVTEEKETTQRVTLASCSPQASKEIQIGPRKQLSLPEIIAPVGRQNPWLSHHQH